MYHLLNPHHGDCCLLEIINLKLKFRIGSQNHRNVEEPLEII